MSMSDGFPYWQEGYINYHPYNFIQSVKTPPEKLESDLIDFIKSHANTFSHEDIKKIKRTIIRAFGLYACSWENRGDRPMYRPGLSIIAQIILQTISDKVTKSSQIMTSNDVTDTLIKFDVCVEFIEKFLTSLCKTEADYTQSSSPITNKNKCDQIAHAVNKYWHGHTPNILQNFQTKINIYHAKVLKLWSDVLIREGVLNQTMIDETRSVVSTKDGYEKKIRELFAECGGERLKPNLEQSMLLKWLALFHVSASNDPSLREITKTYTNLGRANTLDGIIFEFISQFVPIQNTYRFSYIPQSDKHESELNMLLLKCVILEKNPERVNPQQRPVAIAQHAQMPVVYCYLSSDILDQYIHSVNSFPTADQFIQFLNTRRIEKAAAFGGPTVSNPSTHSLFEGTAPPLSEFGGGRNKTRRKIVKKSNKSKKQFRKNKYKNKHLK
jgi:hypothetical protein